MLSDGGLSFDMIVRRDVRASVVQGMYPVCQGTSGYNAVAV